MVRGSNNCQNTILTGWREGNIVKRESISEINRESSGRKWSIAG